MDEKLIEELRSRIEARPRTAAGRRVYTVALKRDVVSFVRTARANGCSQKQAADALGLNKATICGWIREGKPKAGAKVSAVKAVRVETPPTRTGATLELAGGHRVEVLAVRKLAELVKALA